MKYTVTQSRLLFVMTIDDAKHKGLVKIGEVFVDNDVANQGDSSKLKEAVCQELENMTCVAKHFKDYHLEYVECTTYDNIHCYKAKDIHDVLLNSGVDAKHLNKYEKKDADIWFSTALDTVCRAIKAYKIGKKTFNGTDNQVKPRQIVFRPEQKTAISRTVKHFNTPSGKQFLWNAKMRFGKTLCGLEVAKEMGYKTTLIVTHRPVVDKGWSEDFDKIFLDTSKYFYATRMENKSDEKDPKPNHSQDIELADFDRLTNQTKDSDKTLVLFVSMQYLRLSKLVNEEKGDDNPLKKRILNFPWDFVMVDEAHSIGVFGRGGRGTCDHFGVSADVDLIMGTFSKSFASLGGFIATSKEVTNFLRHHSRSYIFTASITPASTAAVNAALDIMESEPERQEALWKVTNFALDGFRKLGCEIGNTSTPIIPLFIRDNAKTFTVTRDLLDEGIFVNPVVSPAVAPEDTLIRFSLMATHTEAQVAVALEKIEKVFKKHGII